MPMLGEHHPHSGGNNRPEISFVDFVNVACRPSGNEIDGSLIENDRLSSTRDTVSAYGSPDLAVRTEQTERTSMRNGHERTLCRCAKIGALRGSGFAVPSTLMLVARTPQVDKI